MRVERLPLDERLSVQACLRQIDFVEGELAALDKIIAADALGDADALRLMTLPGVSAVTAIALRGAIGDISRFRTPRHLVAYLGLDPRVRQSGNEPAKHGKISKQGPAKSAGCSLRRRGMPPAPPGRCARFTSGSLAAAAPTSRPSPSRASS